jgi:2-aminoadipate transaminase
MDALTTVNYSPLLSKRALVESPVPSVRPRAGQSAPLESLYQFAGGMPDPESFPFDGLRAATDSMLREVGRDAMTYGAMFGYDGLRELVCEKNRIFEGFEISADNLLITNGSSHALALAADVLVNPGDPILVEAPTFSGTLYNLRRFSPEFVEVGLDSEGIRTDEVSARLEALRQQGRKAKFIYTIVNFQNPAGMTQSLRRRLELLELAERYDTLILEDDAYGELRYDGEPIKSLYGLDRNERVMRTGTLSKILGAGVRLGWLLAPKPLLMKAAVLKADGGTNPYMSRLATYYMRDHMVGHVEELKSIYRAKRDLMLERLRAGLGDSAEISRPDGGFFIWIRLPEGTDPDKLVELAGNARVSYVPGPHFYPDSTTGREFIRLAFSFASLDDIRVGTDALCEAIVEAKA